jgi:hypothetical protein
MPLPLELFSLAQGNFWPSTNPQPSLAQPQTRRPGHEPAMEPIWAKPYRTRPGLRRRSPALPRRRPSMPSTIPPCSYKTKRPSHTCPSPAAASPCLTAAASAPPETAGRAHRPPLRFAATRSHETKLSPPGDARRRYESREHLLDARERLVCRLRLNSSRRARRHSWMKSGRTWTSPPAVSTSLT